MKIAITGSSGLAKTIKDTLEATPFQGNENIVFTPRIEDITMNGMSWWGWGNVDVLINFAHDDFEQTRILQYAHCLLYTSPSPRDATLSRMPSSA